MLMTCSSMHSVRPRDKRASTRLPLPILCGREMYQGYVKRESTYSCRLPVWRRPTYKEALDLHVESTIEVPHVWNRNDDLDLMMM